MLHLIAKLLRVSHSSTTPFNNHSTNRQKTATGQDLLDKVCGHLQLLEKDWFSCIYKVNNVKVLVSKAS